MTEPGPPLPDPLKRGDFVEATYDGRTVDAMVTVASRNGRSLVIMWSDHMLGGHCGIMPISCDENGCRSLIEDKPITLTRIARAL